MPRLPSKTGYATKDQAKSDKANKFIGHGSERSSTAAYAQAWGDKANGGVYEPGDVVFVSAEGQRRGRCSIPEDELLRAVNAGVTFVTDTPADRARPYNLGEREVAAFLTQHGYQEVQPGHWQPKSPDGQCKPMILVSNVKTDKVQSGYSAIYVGRGRAPQGMEHANLGNPFRVGPEYTQGEAAAAYLPYLRERYRSRAAEYHTLQALAARLRNGERLQLFCWCAPRPCHAEQIRLALEGILRASP